MYYLYITTNIYPNWVNLSQVAAPRSAHIYAPQGEDLWDKHMGVSTNGGTPIAGWFMENPNRKWMMTGGITILGTLIL